MESNIKTIDIRPFELADAQEMFKAVQESLAELPQWLPELNANLTVEDIDRWIRWQTEARAEGSAYGFAIVRMEDGHFLGGCGLTQFNRRHGFANLYYWIRTSCTGQGAATQAVHLLAKFGFEKLDLARLEIVMAVSNHASVRVAQKAGANLEGRLRDRIRIQDTLHDAYMYSFIRRDFLSG